MAAIVGHLMLAAAATGESFEKVLDRVRTTIVSLNLNSPTRPSPDAVSYFRYFGIDFENAAHYFGSFESSGYRLAAHIYIPDPSRGTVFLLHGYLDHSGLLKNIIALLLGMHFSVVVYDLPGHGLSSGEAAAIGDFSEYASVFNDFLRVFGPRLPAPRHLIGHSTGCAIAWEYLHQHAGDPFDRIIFLAPLVHSSHWWLSKAGYRLIDPFVDSIPRTFKDHTSDPKYLAFLPKDPLQSRSIPLRWVKAMFDWEDRIQGYPTLDQTVCIVQGDADTVVDWRYNIAFLQTKFNSLRIRMIPGAKHQLINERADLRKAAFEEIRGCLKNEAKNSQ